VSRESPSCPPHQNRPVISFRNGFADTEAVQSDVLFEGADRRTPLATIAIPTFKRPDFLTEALACALAQDFGRPYEIVVVDNDPDSQCLQVVLDRLPELEGRNFRYVRNRENIGAWGNFNRCILSARGQWLTILQDDDLLDPEYLRLMFEAIDADPGIDGISSRKRFFDQREGAKTDSDKFSPLWNKPMSAGVALKYLVDGANRWELFERLGKRVIFKRLFGRNATRKVRPAHFFWGPVLGNHGGFIFRREAALDIGGFYSEDLVAGDQWFSVRFASRYDLRQHREIAASIRVASNWSSDPTAFLSGLKTGENLSRAIMDAYVPRWWRHVAPLVGARFNNEFQEGFGLNVSREELERVSGERLAKDRPRLLAVLRFLLGGSYPDATPAYPNRRRD
jgi:glycosyltransferase involved in cell wall biosynthesis